MNMTSYYAQTPRFAHEQDIVENDEFQWAPHKTDEIVLKKWGLHGKKTISPLGYRLGYT